MWLPGLDAKYSNELLLNSRRRFREAPFVEEMIHGCTNRAVENLDQRGAGHQLSILGKLGRPANIARTSNERGFSKGVWLLVAPD
jgi:hypothetical protein